MGRVLAVGNDIHGVVCAKNCTGKQCNEFVLIHFLYIFFISGTLSEAKQIHGFSGRLQYGYISFPFPGDLPAVLSFCKYVAANISCHSKYVCQYRLQYISDRFVKALAFVFCFR